MIEKITSLEQKRQEQLGRFKSRIEDVVRHTTDASISWSADTNLNEMTFMLSSQATGFEYITATNKTMQSIEFTTVIQELGYKAELIPAYVFNPPSILLRKY